MKDADKADWDSVAAFINTHGREETRQSGNEESASGAWANSAHLRGKFSAQARRAEERFCNASPYVDIMDLRCAAVGALANVSSHKLCRAWIAASDGDAADSELCVLSSLALSLLAFFFLRAELDRARLASFRLEV